MASFGSGTSPPNESFLSRKKQEILDRSMALLQQSLDRCLDNSVSAPGSSRRRAGKRARDDDEDSAAADAEHHRGLELGEEAAAAAGATRNIGCPGKKRLRHDAGGRKFACPFCKHDPAKYKSVKTCCGPGWEDVHRVKEHVYRRHCLLKNFCPRCLEHFDKPESLKKHQRAEVSCPLKQKASDAITEEQEKQLRARVKGPCSEAAKWEDMYRIIFPGAHVPSPYYDSDSDASHSTDKSQFKSMDECREFLRTEIPRLVKPAIEKYVNELFQDVQDKVNQKTLEVVHEVQTKLLRTFHFQEEQSSSPSLAAANASEPSLPPSPELTRLNQMLEDLGGDSFYNELLHSVDIEAVFAESPFLPCENSGLDSAYYTSSLNGSQGPFALEGQAYVGGHQVPQFM